MLQQLPSPQAIYANYSHPAEGLSQQLHNYQYLDQLTSYQNKDVHHTG
jgi:hypothetical protein